MTPAGVVGRRPMRDAELGSGSRAVGEAVLRDWVYLALLTGSRSRDGGSQTGLECFVEGSQDSLESPCAQSATNARTANSDHTSTSNAPSMCANRSAGEPSRSSSGAIDGPAVITPFAPATPM